MTDASDAERVRLDKWLWAARFFKTRSLAAAAVAAGKIEVNGERAKRARALRAGDAVTIRRPPFESHIVVRALSEHRGPAAVAALLYTETPASVAAREALAAQLRALPASPFEKGRPTKKDRRTLDRWRRR
jgi:ribosome-associated heat shock protein Hsp15